MKISRDDAIAILLAMGFATCIKWDKARMNRKMTEVSGMDPDALELDDESISDAMELKRLNKILVEMGKTKTGEIEVVKEVDENADDTPDDEPEDDTADPEDGDAAEDGDAVEDAPQEDGDADPEPDPKKVKKNKKAEKAKAKAKAGKKSKEPKVKKVGVIATILKCLQDASEKTPVTRKGVLECLVVAFPDREEKSMKSTISVQLGPRIEKDKGVVLAKNDEGGFWLK